MKSEITPRELIEAAGQHGYYYLASPYTHPRQSVMDHRAYEVLQQSGHLTKLGVPHYSPIWAKHRITTAFKLPSDIGFWWAHNLPLLHHACGVIIAVMNGWGSSKGVAREIDYCVTSLRRPVYCTDPQSDGLRFYKFSSDG